MYDESLLTLNSLSQHGIFNNYEINVLEVQLTCGNL